MMSLTMFNAHIKKIIESCNAENPSEITKASFRKTYNYLVETFDDQDGNLKSWLKGNACWYRHPITGNDIEIYIGRDVEALYYFLLFCYKLNNDKYISQEFCDYLSLVLARSNYEGVWEY